MEMALFIAFVFFGRITWPIFYALVTIIWHLITCPFVDRAPKEKKKEKPVERKPKAAVKENNEPEPEKLEDAELPFEQKVIFCTNIIEDAYSYKDYFLDELYEGTEHPIFSVPDCLECSDDEYFAQFGKKWEDAWVDALALAFGIPFKKLGKGCFSGDNIQ